jgi:hypothetical protein
MVTIKGKELKPIDNDTFINLAGTYGDLQIVNFDSNPARLSFTDNASRNSLLLTSAILINKGEQGDFFDISFFRDFEGPPNGKVRGSVSIDGSFATGSGLGKLDGAFFLFVGGVENNPIDGPLTLDANGKPSGTTFNEQGSDKQDRSLLGPRRLEGDLSFFLGPNERMGLPGSATVGLTSVPEPGAILLFALGMIGCPGLLVWRTRRKNLWPITTVRIETHFWQGAVRAAVGLWPSGR